MTPPKKLRAFGQDLPERLPRKMCSQILSPMNLHERKWRLKRGEQEPFVCSREAVVEVRGQPFCRLHGGHAALDMYLRGEIVDKEKT